MYYRTPADVPPPVLLIFGLACTCVLYGMYTAAQAQRVAYKIQAKLAVLDPSLAIQLTDYFETVSNKGLFNQSVAQAKADVILYSERFSQIPEVALLRDQRKKLIKRYYRLFFTIPILLASLLIYGKMTNLFPGIN